MLRDVNEARFQVGTEVRTKAGTRKGDVRYGQLRGSVIAVNGEYITVAFDPETSLLAGATMHISELNKTNRLSA